MNLVPFVRILLCLLVLGAAVPRHPAGARNAAKPGTPTPQAFSADAAMPTYGAWHSSRIGGGGYVQNVVLCPSNANVAYAYVDVGGAYRSEDGGAHWRMLHGGLPARAGCYEVRGLSVDPRSDKNVLVAVGSQWSAPEGVYASKDGGKTWRQTLTCPFFGNGPMRAAGLVLVRQPGSPSSIIAASVDAGVFRSTDNGQTWTACSGAGGLYPTGLLFDKNNPQRVWLCASALKAWFGSTEKTWPRAFYMSTDGGKTWSKTSDLSPAEVVQDKDGRIVGIFDFTAVRESADGGKTWTDAGAGLPLNPAAAKDYSTNAYTAALAAGPGYLALATGHGIFYKRVSGQTQWTKIAEAGPNSACGDWWGAYKPGVWSHVGAAVGSIVIDPHNPAHWFFTDWYAVYQSQDTGKHWNLSVDGIESTVIHSFAQDSSEPGRVHVGMADLGYFQSSDGGVTFRQGTAGITNNIKDISIAPADPKTVYAVGPQGSGWYANLVFVSHDAGQTWTRSPMTGLPDMSQSYCNSIVADARDPQTVYLGVSGSVAAGKGGPYKSTDGGQTWAWMGEGLPAAGGFFRSAIFGGVGREMAVSGDGALIAVSHDTGQVWRRGAADTPWVKSGFAAGGQPNCLVADLHVPGRFYLAVMGGGLYRTDDAGRTWTQKYKGSTAYVAVDAALPGRATVSTDDGVLLSMDSGETWTRLDASLPARVFCSLGFAGSRLLAGSSGSGVFWIDLPPTPRATKNEMRSNDSARAPAKQATWNHSL